MLNIDAEIFELFDEQLDFVLFGVAAHVAKLFILVAGDDLVDYACDPVGDSDLRLVSRA